MGAETDNVTMAAGGGGASAGSGGGGGGGERGGVGAIHLPLRTDADQVLT